MRGRGKQDTKEALVGIAVAFATTLFVEAAKKLVELGTEKFREHHDKKAKRLADGSREDS